MDVDQLEPLSRLYLVCSTAQSCYTEADRPTVAADDCSYRQAAWLVPTCSHWPLQIIDSPVAWRSRMWSAGHTSLAMVSGFSFNRSLRARV